MISPYKITTECDGENHVNILLPKSNTDYELIWNITLKGDDEPIVFKAFYNTNRFAVVNWNGWVRIYDIDTKKIILNEKLDFEINTKAVLSPDFQSLYVIGNKDDQALLTIFSLQNEPEIISQIPINKDCYGGSLHCRIDGNLLLYFNTEEWSKPDKPFKHGFYLLDFDQQQLTLHTLPYPQLDQFEAKEPLIVPEINRGCMPLWDKVNVVSNDSGEDLFEFSLLIFTLDTFEVVNKIPVRLFKQQELAYYESECENMAEAFKAGVVDNEYNDQLIEFCGNLNSITYHADSNAIWLCWRGGILVRLNLHDNSLSPLLATASLPGSTIKGAFNFTSFHSEIEAVQNEYIILKEHDDLYELSLKEIDLSPNKNHIEITLAPYNLNILTSSKPSEEKKYRSKIIIDVDDLSKDASIQDALDQMILLTKNIDTIRKGDILAFAVKDKNERIMCDDTFFEIAAKSKNALDKIAVLVRQFANYPKAKSLYIHEEACSLCYANIELAKADIKYIDIVFEYLAAIDEDHDVFNREILIPLLVKKYRDTEYLKLIIKRLTEISELWVEGVEMYLEENE